MSRRFSIFGAVVAALWALAAPGCGSDAATTDGAGFAGAAGASGSAAGGVGGTSGLGVAAGGGSAARGGSGVAGPVGDAAGRGGRSGGADAGSRAQAGRGGAGRGGAGRGGAGSNAAGSNAAGSSAAGASGMAASGGTGGRAGASGAGGVASSAGSSGSAGAAGSSALDAACSPPVRVEIADPTGAGAGFARSVPDPEALVQEVARTLCRILYRAPDEPRKPAMILLRVYDFDGVANAGGTTINLSTRHLANYSGAALTEEITGVLVHEATHLYQYNDGPGGLIEGIADYVRIEAGHHSLDRRRPGGNWDDGYTTTGFFLSWLDDRHQDFGYELNQALTRDDNRGWSEQVFMELTGKDVDTLWREYQAAL